MIRSTYDPDADAAFIEIGKGKVARSEEVSPQIIVDFDGAGRVLGFEILTASRVLAAGTWTKAARPGDPDGRADAAE